MTIRQRLETMPEEISGYDESDFFDDVYDDSVLDYIDTKWLEVW